MAGDACMSTDDALITAKKFVRAAEAHDTAGIVRCTYSAALLDRGNISEVEYGGWLLDQVGSVRTDTNLKMGPDTVGFDFPHRLQQRSFIDANGQPMTVDLQSGIQIAVTKEPDGRWYVTDILGYVNG